LSSINTNQVKEFLLQLQEEICKELESIDSVSRFQTDQWQRDEGGSGLSRVISDGDVFEKGGVNFSHVFGESMPASATAQRPELAGRAFQAMGVSLVIHPLNPFVPTSHANFRMFIADKTGEESVWWFGGGYDLTPYYGNDDDCIHWHQTARTACGIKLRERHVSHSVRSIIRSLKNSVMTIFKLNIATSPEGLAVCFSMISMNLVSRNHSSLCVRWLIATSKLMHL